VDKLEKLYSEWLDTIINPDGDDYSMENQRINDGFINLIEYLKGRIVDSQAD